MTHEHQFEMIKDIIVATPTIFFTAFIAYWNWKRDQERVKVEIVPPSDGSTPIGVSITNLSLFTVRICKIVCYRGGEQF